MALSRLAAARVRAHGIRLRETLSAETTVASPVWPAGKTRMRVACDLSAAHQLDPTRTLTVVTEISSDGVNWSHWCGFTTAGTADRDTQPGWPDATQPSLRCPAPPEGMQVRTRIVPGAQSVDTGLVVTGS